MASLWRNWTGDQRCAPAEIAQPASEAELAEIIARARARALSVRAAGSGHSFTDIACTDGVMVRLGRMNRVLDADPATGRVRVQSGITLHELGERLAEHGLALENMGDIDAQTLAGALSTATHGTGARYGNLATQVASLRLVTADGSVAELDEDDEDRDGWLAARVSLGALGVISEVELRCVPAFTLHRIDEPRPLAETLERFHSLVEENEHFEFFAMPYTDVAMCRKTNRTERPPHPRDAVSAYVQDVLLENRALELFCRAGRAFPKAIPALNRRLAGFFSRTELVDRSHRVHPNRRDVRFTEMEYALPREAGPEVVRRVFDLIERRRLPVNFPIEVRAVAADDALLSPAHERPTTYIAVHTYQGMEFESYFRGVESIMDEHGGRPHWGKRHYQSAATLRERYPRWDSFQEVRGRLDPDGVFVNDYTRRVLGPVGAELRAPA
jgi:L-gulono-1,4-lactone dehydrogenase